ncbi:MAG: PorT family protein [Cytophagales bacterium]|jgi:hypothetical protein|nr:PorT family protein [Cytophagales bacterium]
MKKNFIVTLFFAMLAGQTFGQISFGAKAGANFASGTSRVVGQKIDISSVTGFHAGGIVDIALNDYVSIQPELLFSQKGGEGRFLSGNILLTDRTNYLELPLSIVGKVEAGPGKVFVGAGGYAAALLGGRRRTETNIFIGTVTDTRDIRVGNTDDDEYRPLDFGLNFKAGYEFDFGVFVSGNYSLGLYNLVPDGDEDNYVRNGYIGISVGYLFRNK